MLIIGISGIKAKNDPIWLNMEKACKREFPNATFVVEEEYYVSFWEILRPRGIMRFRRFIDRLVDKYKHHPGPILLKGSSMGGIVACALASRLNNVCGVVTMFSPHGFLGGIYPLLLGAHRDLRVPIITFQIKPDWVVPWGTKHRQSLQHIVLHSNVHRAHKNALAQEPCHARRITKYTKQFIFPRPEE